MTDPKWPTLEAVAADVQICTLCGLCTSRTNAVPGEGSATSGIMFIGEGPGYHEDQQGRPFVGRAGELLNDLLRSVPLHRADVFITNVVKCRAPENRDPMSAEVDACRPYLESQIALLGPRVIVPLGRHSLGWFFPDARISREHGRMLRWRDYVVFPVYHPAAALRSTSVREMLEADMKRLPQVVVAALDPSSAAPASEIQDKDSSGPADDGHQQLGLF